MTDKQKPRKRHIRRKMFTYGFKGRPRRALLWRKPLYKQWFEYAKLAQSLGHKIPKAFGDLSKFEFEDWWKHPDYGFELFCEPDLEPVKVMSGKQKRRPNTALFEITIGTDADVILRDFKSKLKEVNQHTEYVSQARFQPSTASIGLKPEKLALALKTYKLNKVDGVSRTQVIKQLFQRASFQVEVLQPDGKRDKAKSLDYERWEASKFRTVTNHNRVVREAFKAISQGTFPTPK